MLVSSPAQFDFVLNFEIVLVDEIVGFNLVGRDDDFFRRSAFGAQRGNDVLIAHLPAEFFVRLALRLKRLHQRDAVAEPFADAFLDHFVHDGLGQPVALRVKVMQNQLPLD